MRASIKILSNFLLPLWLSFYSIMAYSEIASYNSTTQQLNLNAVQLSDGRQFQVEMDLIPGNDIRFNLSNLTETSNQATSISYDLSDKLLTIPMVNVNDVFYSASLLLGTDNILTLQTLYKTGPFISQGRATTTTSNLLDNCSGSRISGLGTISSLDGVSFTVPGDNNYSIGPAAADLYNDCSGVKLTSINDLNIDTVPIVEIDADGEVISAYIFADNYFELYVNGVLIVIDPVPFTPFNSNVVRFKVNKPYTYAIKLIDWEENLGLGSENNGGNSYHAGDGGFIASFSDGIVTDNQWKAQTFYIAPLQTSSEIEELSDGTHSSANSSTSPSCQEDCYAIHHVIPSGWTSESFSDADWPQATTYTNETVGVDNKPAFTNFSEQFSSAQFIWSSNLVLDNLVLVRRTVN